MSQQFCPRLEVSKNIGLVFTVENSADNARCETCAILKDFRVSAKCWLAPNEFRSPLQTAVCPIQCFGYVVKNFDIHVDLQH